MDGGESTSVQTGATQTPRARAPHTVQRPNPIRAESADAANGRVRQRDVLRDSPKSGRAVKHKVHHEPRNSLLDRTNSSSSGNTFSGFFVLFWTILAVCVLNALYASFEKTGEVLSMTFASLFSRDAFMLMLSDAVLVLHLFLCVPIIKLAHRFNAFRTAQTIQYAWEAALLYGVIQWTQYR